MSVVETTTTDTLRGASTDSIASTEDVAVVSPTAAYRDLAEYERTWGPTRGVSKAAFGEVDPLFARMLDYLSNAGWV